MNTDEPRLRYAVAALTELFPGATVTTGSGGGGSQARTFAQAPSGRRPRLLVPTAPRDAAAAAMRSYGGRLTRRARGSYRAAAGALAITGPAPLRARLSVTATGNRPAGIDDHLGEVLSRQVGVAVHLTPSRANRKPIVQALAADERHPVAFAKVAVGPLTTRLVEQEAQALSTLAEHSLAHLVVPRVLDHSEFAGHQVLTMQPLPTWLPGRSPTMADAAAAAREVASLAEVTRLPLQESAYWHGVQQQASGLAPTPRAARLVSCTAQLTSQLGPQPITFTASHGDWSPWNMWRTRSGLLVWDWERFEPAIPQGFDLLHFRLNDQLIRGSWRGADAATHLLDEAPDVLAATGITDSPRRTALLYLLHLGLRYEADGQAEAGVALGQLETWLLPALEAGLSDPVAAKRV